MDINTNYSLNSNVSMKGNLSTIAKKLDGKGTMLEKEFDELVLSIKKGENGVIDKASLDSADKKVFEELSHFFNRYLGKFQGTIDNLKEFYKGGLTRITDEMYNGTNAKVTRDLYGKLRSVNTGAKDLKEARAHMGLNKVHNVEVIDENGSKYMPTYGREYRKDNGTQKEYFIWNPETKAMDLEWGSWIADKVK